MDGVVLRMDLDTRDKNHCNLINCEMSLDMETNWEGQQNKCEH